MSSLVTALLIIIALLCGVIAAVTIGFTSKMNGANAQTIMVQAAGAFGATAGFIFLVITTAKQL